MTSSFSRRQPVTIDYCVTWVTWHWATSNAESKQRALRAEYCIVGIPHNTAIWLTRVFACLMVRRYWTRCTSISRDFTWSSQPILCVFPTAPWRLLRSRKHSLSPSPPTRTKKLVIFSRIGFIVYRFSSCDSHEELRYFFPLCMGYSL